jgi:hypothetical protein
MKIPYDVINEALAKELPDVDLRPDPLKKRAFILRFHKGYTEERAAKATALVNEMLPSRWYPDEVRRL